MGDGGDTAGGDRGGTLRFFRDRNEFDFGRAVAILRLWDMGFTV